MSSNVPRDDLSYAECAACDTATLRPEGDDVFVCDDCSIDYDDDACDISERKHDVLLDRVDAEVRAMVDNPCLSYAKVSRVANAVDTEGYGNPRSEVGRRLQILESHGRITVHSEGSHGGKVYTLPASIGDDE